MFFVYLKFLFQKVGGIYNYTLSKGRFSLCERGRTWETSALIAVGYKPDLSTTEYVYSRLHI